MTAWRDRLESLIARAGLRVVDRVAVVAQTASTQDTARAMAGGRPGLVVLAGRQTGGRGRLGRVWVQHADLGLAMTIALDADRFVPEHVSLAAGVAAAESVAACLPSVAIGLRWPNDVVERSGGRKIAGVLVESEGPLLLVGIGVNVAQRPADWPPGLRDRAVSVHELGGSPDRIGMAEAVLRALDAALTSGEEELLRCWRLRDVLTGRAAAFVQNGQRYEGMVVGIDPRSAILVRTADGREVRLPALTTSLVH